ncbi:MAG: DNA-3-methyladenine glycosylase 2 family protein, partial [Actinomycetota bacterium]|nr:DNA-3-methyladenine glycosylase 2 family protein [Actinomycetota bacterium]
FEMAVRAVIGQQVSFAAASTIVGRVVALAGKPLTAPDGVITHVFPSAELLAETDLGPLGVPATRRKTLVELARRVAGGEIDLDPGADREATHEALLRIPGIGPWTASYVVMRALGDPDAFLPTDLGVKKVAAQLGISDLAMSSEKWRPWRSYAVQYLWSAYE